MLYATGGGWWIGAPIAYDSTMIPEDRTVKRILRAVAKDLTDQIGGDSERLMTAGMTHPASRSRAPKLEPFWKKSLCSCPTWLPRHYPSLGAQVKTRASLATALRRAMSGYLVKGYIDDSYAYDEGCTAAYLNRHSAACDSCDQWSEAASLTWREHQADSLTGCEQFARGRFLTHIEVSVSATSSERAAPPRLVDRPLGQALPDSQYNSHCH